MENKAAENAGEGNARKSERPLFARRRRMRPPVDMKFSYTDVETLRQFVSEHGKIVPRRICHLSAQQQRQLRLAVKRARILALLPFAGRDR